MKRKGQAKAAGEPSIAIPPSSSQFDAWAAFRGTTRDEARAYMSLDSLTFLLDTWAAFQL